MSEVLFKTCLLYRINQRSGTKIDRTRKRYIVAILTPPTSTSSPSTPIRIWQCGKPKSTLPGPASVYLGPMMHKCEVLGPPPPKTPEDPARQRKKPAFGNPTQTPSHASGRARGGIVGRVYHLFPIPTPWNPESTFTAQFIVWAANASLIVLASPAVIRPVFIYFFISFSFFIFFLLLAFIRAEINARPVLGFLMRALELHNDGLAHCGSFYMFFAA